MPFSPIQGRASCQNHRGILTSAFNQSGQTTEGLPLVTMTNALDVILLNILLQMIPECHMLVQTLGPFLLQLVGVTDHQLYCPLYCFH